MLSAMIGVLLAEHGNPPETTAWYESILEAVNRGLAANGMEHHREPRTRSELGSEVHGVTLGFYSAPTYRRLHQLAAHVAEHGVVPPTRHLGEHLPAALDPRTGCAHLVAALGYRAVVLPRAFDCVIPRSSAEPLRGPIVSAVRLEREAVFLSNALARHDERDPDFDWVLHLSGRSAPLGLVLHTPTDPAIAREWTAEADLVGRLSRLARMVIASRALALVA